MHQTAHTHRNDNGLPKNNSNYKTLSTFYALYPVLFFIFFMTNLLMTWKSVYLYPLLSYKRKLKVQKSKQHNKLSIIS